MQKELFNELVSDMEDYTRLEFEGDYNIIGLQKMQTGFFLSIYDKYFNQICNLSFDRIETWKNEVFLLKGDVCIGILHLKNISPRKIKVA